MKKLLQVVLLFAVLTVCAEVKKLALIGDDKICSLLTVELSNDDNIQLLERAEIDKVLKEHKLSDSGLAASQLAKLFPHVNIFAMIQDKRLAAFNAKNGFRLMDANASKVQELAKLIRLAVKKLTLKNPLYVSIVSVRDIGVPRRHKSKIKDLTRTLEQELMKQPNIQMLERSHLTLVNEERELTEKHYNLKSSARLLTLEFEPGDKANIVNLKALIRNLENKIVGRARQADAFRDIPESVQAMCRQIKGGLNIDGSAAASRRAEAKRFFLEYTKVNSLAEKLEKLEAAVVLDPMNEKYRFAQFLPDAPDWENRIKRLQRAEKLYPAFKRDFPNSKRRLAYQLSPDMYINHFNTVTYSQDKWLEAYCDRIRSDYELELRREAHFDLSDGIDSMREMRNYESYIYNTIRVSMYWNMKRAHEARYQGLVKLVRQWDKFLKMFPKYKNRAPRLLEISKLNWHRNWKLEQFKFYCKYLDSISDFHAVAVKSSLPVAKAESALLLAKQKLLRANSTEECQAIYFEMFETFYQLDKKFWKDFGLFPTSPFSGFLFNQFRRINYYRFKISYPKNPAAEALVLFLKQKHGDKMFSMLQFKELLNTYKKKDVDAYFDRVLRHVPQIRQLQLQRLKKSQGIFPQLGNQIFWQNYNLLSTPKVQKILTGLNAAFDITYMPYTNFSHSQKFVRCRGVIRYKNKLYLLLGKKMNIGEMLLVELDTDFKSRIVAKIPKIAWIKDFPAWHVREKNYRMDMNDHYIAIAGKDKLLVIDRRSGRQRILPDLWSDWKLRGLALCGDRIYFAAIRSGGKIMMKSVSVDGSKRKTIFNSHRSEKLNEFDAVDNGDIFIFQGLANGKIIFRLQGYHKTGNHSKRSNSDKLVIFDPQTGKFNSRTLDRPVHYRIEWLKETESKILLSGDYSTPFILELDPDTLSWKIAVARDKYLAKYRPEYQLTGYGSARPRYLLDGADLWCGGENSCYINLAAPEKSPMLFISPFTLDIEKFNDKIIYFDYMHLTAIKKNKEGTQK
jgi:hypothetical protein